MATNKVLQAIVEIAGSVSPTLASAVNDTCSKLEKVNLKAVAVGAAAAAGAVAVGKAAIDAGKYLVDLGSQFDSVTDSIRIGTGATGDALDSLMDDFNAVYSSVPTSMDDAAKAIADYNTRLGLTGEALQGISKQAIQVADMLDEDLGGVIESSSQAFQQWNIDADNMGDAMDYVFKVSQSTGMGFSELMTNVQQYGAQLQEMGYSFNEATALIGQLDKAGVNASEVLSAMKKSVSALAKEGVSASDGLSMYTDAIMNAKDMTEATTIASEIFGTKAASTMAAAIRSGAVNVDELTKSLEANSETINGCAADTYDYAEQLQLFKQKAQVALEPLAATMFNSLNELMPVVGDLMQSLIPVIQNLSKTLTPVIEGLVAKIGPMLTDLVPPIMNIVTAVAEKLIPPLLDIIVSIIPVLIQLAELLMPIIEFIATQILPAIVSVLKALLPGIMKIVQAVLPVVINLLNRIMPLLTQMIEAVLPVIIQLIDTLLPVIMQIVDAVLPIIVDLMEELLPIITKLITDILPIVNQLLSALLPIVGQIIESVLPILIEILNVLSPILDLIISLLGPILQLIVDIVSPILNLITTAIGPLISIISTMISTVLEPLKPLIQIIADLFSGVLGNAIQGLQPIINALTGVFNGLISFIQNVFAGNWKGVWDSIVQIFRSIWDGVVAIFKMPINWIIDGINTFIKGLNKIKVPDWVPAIGGKGINIPLIPRLAEGGFTDGISIAGEAGTEAVISFDPAYREKNISTWTAAGKLLGVLDGLNMDEGTKTAAAASIRMIDAEKAQSDAPLIAQAGKLASLDDFSLGELTETTIIYYDFSGFTWAPTVEGGAAADKEDIMEALKDKASEFFDWLEEWLRQKEVGKYDRVSIY